jgi:hypothetical protein
MIAKNVNTHAYGDIHIVVLTHLRRRWSLSDRDGFGALSQKVKCLFYIDRTLLSG